MKFKTELTKQEVESKLNGIRFYHSFEFENGAYIPGDWNITVDLKDYKFPKSMKGMKVLDIGPASGWFSFYFESLGADVTVVETRGYQDFDVYGVWSYSDPEKIKSKEDKILADGKKIYLGPVSESFWAVHEVLNSNVKWVNGRVYEVSPELFDGEAFDFVFMGSLLPHLRDPIGALRAARSVCKDTLYATASTWLDLYKRPHMGLLFYLRDPLGALRAARSVCKDYLYTTASKWFYHDEYQHPIMVLPYTDIDKISWWLPNKACYEHWFKAAGFSAVDVENLVKSTPENIVMKGNVRMNDPMVFRLGIASP